MSAPPQFHETIHGVLLFMIGHLDCSDALYVDPEGGLMASRIPDRAAQDTLHSVLSEVAVHSGFMLSRQHDEVRLFLHCKTH